MRFFPLFAVGAVVVSAVENNAMRKIVELLQGMKKAVEQESIQGRKDANEYADWCIKTTTETQADIKYGSEKVEELNAIAEDGAARATASRAEAAECGMAIGKSQQTQKVAKDERKEQQNIFNEKEAELVEADTMLGKAYSVLKRNLSLMQTAEQQGSNRQVATGRMYTEEVVGALGQIIESAFTDPSESNKIASFLEDMDSLSMGQPQANVRAYESKSGGILETIQNMQEKNAEILGKLRQQEMASRHQYELLVQDEKNLSENKSEQMAAAKEVGAKADATGKEAAANASETADVLASDKRNLSETKVGCEKAAKAWTARETDAAQEVSVIAQAVDILTGKFGENPKNEGAFLQMRGGASYGSETAEATGSMQAANYKEQEVNFEKRQKAADILRKLGREYNQFALVQAAQLAQSDTFAKVRGLISDLIDKLEKEAHAEASKEAKCKTDKEKGAKDLKVKTSQFDKLASRENANKAKEVKLGEDIKDLQQQLRELADTVSAATNFRNKEKVDNAAVVKEATESVGAISAAIQTLSEYYGATDDSAMLLQLSVAAGSSMGSMTTEREKRDTANVILEMLQTAQEDFEKMKQETEMAEATQNDKYDKLIHNAEVTKTKKTGLMNGKGNEKASVKVQLTQISEDLVDAEKALTASSDFLRTVTEQCANKAQSFDERQQRREEEIAGLRDALDILSSDSGALLQTAFLGKK